MRKKRVFLTLMAILILLCSQNAAASPLETLMGLAAGEKASVPIIMYHALEDSPDNKWEITVQEFESDLQYLSKNGYTAVFVQDLIDFVHKGKDLPEKPIVLSFDDGRSPTIDIILPLLEKYNSCISMAIIGTETDHYTRIDMEGKIKRHPHMTWNDVKNAADSGLVEISSHTYDLHGKNGVRKLKRESTEDYRKRLLGDLDKFAETLKDNIGISSNALVYPLGIFSSSSDEIIREAGYLASLSCQEGVNTLVVGDEDCLFGLKRYLRPPNRSSEEIFAKFEENRMMNDE